MNHKTLRSQNSEAVRVYVTRKFKSFNSFYYTKAKRKKRCMEYYIAASFENKSIVDDIYQKVFRESFPRDEAGRLEEEMLRKFNGPNKIEFNSWLGMQNDKLEDAQHVLATLQQWKEEQAWQRGEDFFLEMRSLIAQLDPTLCNPRELMTEWELKRVATLTGSTTRTSREVAAEFDAMIGMKQSAALKFTSYSGSWGQIDAALKESFKAGAWANGQAKAKLERTGLSLEAQVAVAIGAELNLDAECSWKKGKAGLDLKGNANLFLGASGDLSAKLSVDALKGLEMSIKAGAFAGFKASVSGTATFKYGDEALISAKAQADFVFGVAAEFEASIKAPIFGATEIKFGADVAVGLGTGVKVETEINFKEIYLAGREQFTKVLYLPTLAKGYKMDLMTQDAKNLYYLNKCLVRIAAQVESLGEKIESHKSIPSEKQPLLMSFDDD